MTASAARPADEALAAKVPLRLLLIEDSEDDALLVLRELRRSGFEPKSSRIETAQAMREALHSQSWDLILSDFVLPDFGGLEALAIARQSGLDLPFILVSSKVSEETMVDAMRAGAADFVMKDRLSRLGAAVQRELADAATRQRLTQTQLEWRTVFDAVQDAIFIHDGDFRIVRANLAYAELAQMPIHDVIGRPYWEVFPKHEGPLPQCQSGAERSGITTEPTLKVVNREFASRSFPIKNGAGAYCLSVHVLQDMTGRNREQRRTAALLDLAVSTTELDEQSILQQGVNTLLNLTGSKVGFLHFVSEDQNELELVAWSTDKPELYRQAGSALLPTTAGGVSWTDSIRLKQPLVINDCAAAAQQQGQLPASPDWQRMVSVPVLDEQRVRMVVGIGNAPVDYVKDDLETIQLFAMDLYRIVKRQRAELQTKTHVKQLEATFMNTVKMATTLNELRDPYTIGHERRVADMAAAIGAAMGFDSRRQEGLRVAGLLHDVGKISIPAEILAKPGKLTPIEFLLIKEHAQAGFNVLKEVNFPWPVAEAALQHHERLNGSGYPQGLQGEAIMLEARILAVADVVEAMSSHRPYRAGLGIDRALAEIEHGRGTEFDPLVVDACLKLFREQGYVISG